VTRRGLFRRGVESRGAVPGGGPNLRFPGYDVTAAAGTWDAVTAGVVLARLGPPPPIRFFTVAEQATGSALFDLLLDQRDEPKVPVLEMVDARLAEFITDGWRHDDMPEDGDAFRLTFALLDEDAHMLRGQRFHELSVDVQAEVVQRIQDLADDGKAWHGFVATHVWSLWTRYACAAFYAHPWAWNEIGFGGPAYPRGYKNLGGVEPWEVRDHVNREPIEFGAIVENYRREHARHDGVE